MRALISFEHDAPGIDEERIEGLIALAARRLDIPDPSEVSITFVTDEDMASLNEQYRGKTGPTDVLSFECDNLEDGFPDEGDAFQAGDIIIAPDVARAQAEELGHSFAEEIDTLLVHGVLHLMGYDHIEDADAEQMQRMQDDILSDRQEVRERGGRG